MDVRLSRLLFVTPLDDVPEALGGSVETAGSRAMRGEATARSQQLKLPVRAPDDAVDQAERGARLRRQVRSLLQNELALSEPVSLAIAFDPELDGWLVIGGGDLTDEQRGITFGEWALELRDVYRLGSARTHRVARRLTVLDRRLSTTPRDALRKVYSTDFAGIPVVPVHHLPPGHSDVLGLADAPLTPAAVPSAGGNVGALSGRVHGETVHFEQDPAQIAGGSDVVIHDTRGVANRITQPGAENVWYDEAVLADNPALFWDDMGGALAYDRSGNGRHGLFVSNPAKVAAPTADDTFAADLDGSADYITSDYSPFVNGSTRTFEAWVRRDSSGSADAIFAGASATGPYFQLHASVDGAAGFDPQLGAGATATAGYWATTGPAGTWMHIVLVFNEATDTAELFVNGVSKGTQTVADPYSADPGTFKVGAISMAASNALDGAVSKVAVYESALSAARILAHYQARNVKGPRPFVDRVRETFDGASLARYAYDSGSGNVSESGGALVSNGALAELYHAARTYGDVERITKFTVQATGGIETEGHTFKRLDGDNLILCRFQGEGLWRIIKEDGGVQSTLQSITLAAPFVSGGVFWARTWIAGNVINTELWTTEPSPGGTPAYEKSHTLTGADATKFGAGVVGHAGLRIGTAGAQVDDDTIRPLSRPTVRRSTAWAAAGAASVRQQARQQTEAVNYVTNPRGGAGNQTGWSALGSVVLRQAVTFAAEGIPNLALPDGRSITTGFHVVGDANAEGVTLPLPGVVIGERFQYAFYVYIKATDGPRLRTDLRAPSTASRAVKSSGTQAPGEWFRLENGYVMDEAGNWLLRIYQDATAGSNLDWYYTAVLVEKGPAVSSAYFDGDSGQGYQWRGTPHASESVRVAGPPAGLLVGARSELVAAAAGEQLAARLLANAPDQYATGALAGVAFYDASQRLISVDHAAGTERSAVAPAGTARAALVQGGVLQGGEQAEVRGDVFTLVPGATPSLDPLHVADPQESGWEEVYGGDYPLTAGRAPIVGNGIVRVRYDPAFPGRLLIDHYVTGWTEVGALYFTREGTAGDNQNVAVDAHPFAAFVVEWTPERAVVKLSFVAGAAGSLDVFVTLQRGWNGPRLEVYPRGKVGARIYFASAFENRALLAKHNGAAMSHYRWPDIGGGSWPVGNLTDFSAASAEPWMALLTNNRTITMVAQRAADVARITQGLGGVYPADRPHMAISGYPAAARGYVSAHLAVALRGAMREAELHRNATATNAVVEDAAASSGQAIEETQTALNTATVAVPGSSLSGSTFRCPLGRYRLFARVRAVDAGATVSIKGYFSNNSAWPTQTVTSTSWTWVDLGERIRDDEAALLYLILWRSAGTGAVRIDEFALLPVESRIDGTYEGARDIAASRGLLECHATPDLIAR